MNVKFNEKEKILFLEIVEELDHHTSEKIRRRADYEIQIYIPKKVIIDFSNVNFMDSAGIGLIIGRYKLISLFGGDLELINVKDNIKKVLELSGVLNIIKIKTEENEEEKSEKII